MKLTNHKWFSAGGWMGLLSIAVCLMGVLPGQAAAQAISTTTVQGTVYLANGQPGTGTLVVSWPSFTTASGQLVTADSTTVAIAPDGFVSVNLAANVGASPAGLYYTAVYYMSDGSTNTQYWVVPAGAQATLGQVQAQLMPATQAVQAVNKAYVDQAIAGLSESLLTASGGTLSGPLTLCCDPTQPMQAADKHYVDAQSALAVPLTGATMTGPLTSVELGALYQVDQFPGADFGAKLGACLSGLSSINGGTCDARNFTGTQAMGSNLTISTANATVLLPCATISTANQIIVTAGTRNVSLHGCALRGTSAASGSQGGTVFLYSGTKAMVQVGDPTYVVDTQGIHLDNVAINTTSSNNASAQGLTAYRTQEMELESLYFLGNSNQTGMTLDGTGNYTGGTFLDDDFDGFQTAVNAIGHQKSNPATTDWMNASTFLRLHIDCPTSGGNPISGSYGINLQQGDGNTFTGGDIEGCATALHLGANAQNNTIVGLRNENSTNQIVADAGSSYNSWMTGGTMFTGQLTDNGTRNSFLDAFHRSFNGLNGDWYGSQADATLTNHYRLGIGAGNERGLLNEIQTDYGYRWLEGYSDATAGEQFYQIDDLLNNVNRLSIGQYNNGQSSTNDQTAINSAGTGAVVLNGSANAGTGGVVIGSGGASESTVATISGAGNAQFNGSLQVGGASTLAGSATVKNQGNAEIDYILQAGATASQKESLIYNDWNGNSQWYMVKDANNDWALNSATGGLDSFKAYQSTNSGDTYIDAANNSGVVRINYETGAGTGFKVYGGSSSTLYASFTGVTAIQFPGLAASNGHNCLQVDNSGYISNTGAACGTGSTNGTVNAGTSGQIAFYNGSGTVLSGTNTVSVSAGGTGASTASGALGNLGGAAITGAAFTGPVSAPSMNLEYDVDGFPSSCTVSSVNYTTQTDCAVATLRAEAGTFFANPTLRYHAGNYPTNLGFQFDATTLNATGSHFAINISGDGLAISNIVYQGGSNSSGKMYYVPDYPNSGPWPNPTRVAVKGVTFNMNELLGACLHVYAVEQSTFRDIDCKLPNPSSSLAPIDSGDPAPPASTVSNGYQNVWDNVTVESAGNGIGAWASVTATVSGGTIATNGYTVTSGGTYHYQNPIAYLVGRGNGRYPCATMPTGLSVTTSGSAGVYTVTGVMAATAATGCLGNIYVYVMDMPEAPYGFIFKDTDSTYKDIVVAGIGTTAGIFGGSAFVHPHSYSNPVGIVSGYEAQSIQSIECDSNFDLCASFTRPNGSTYTSPSIIGGHYYFNSSYPSAGGVYLGNGVTGFSMSGVGCSNTTSNFMPIITQYGNYSSGIPDNWWPSGTTVSDVDVCDGSGTFINRIPGPVQSGHSVNFGVATGSTYLACTALSEAGAPSVSGTIISYPTDGSQNSGSVTCTDLGGNITTQNVPSTGAAVQTIDLSVSLRGSSYAWTYQTANGKLTINSSDASPLSVQYNGSQVASVSNTGQINSSMTPAQCLAATSLSAPCQAYSGSFTGLGTTGTTGTITLYSSNAPAGAVLQVCPNIVVDTVGTAGYAVTKYTWTTPGGAAESGNNGSQIVLTTAIGTIAQCNTIVVGAGQSASFVVMTGGSPTGSPIWETEPVVMRLR